MLVTIGNRTINTDQITLITVTPGTIEPPSEASVQVNLNDSDTVNLEGNEAAAFLDFLPRVAVSLALPIESPGTGTGG